MSTNNDGTFFDCRLHRPMPPSSVSDRGVNRQIKVRLLAKPAARFLG
jgi:hypothetical protein